LQRVVQSFSSGSMEQVMAALLDDNSRRNLDEKELDRLENLIREARNRTPNGKPGHG
jgi:hypothetical protein